MDLLTLDFETYYADNYSLSKMTTEAYVRDPRFEMILVSIKVDDAPAFWLLRDRFDHFVKHEVDWSHTALVAHHAHFDGLILNHHFGARPAMWIDTLSMARVIDGPKAGNSLEELCARHGVGMKGNYVTFAKGKHLADFSVAELHAYGRYACNDSDRTYDLAQIFLPQLPVSELKLIDLTVRMFTEPVLIGDEPMLAKAVYDEKIRKAQLLHRVGLLCKTCGGNGVDPILAGPSVLGSSLIGAQSCKVCEGQGVDKKPIGSNEQFAGLLRGFGVEPEMKQGKNEIIYAFAKTDPAMQALLESDKEEVRFLAEARIGIKSNLVLTRAQRYHDCASRGPMPVYTKHAGAHTLRPSGGDGLNWLNMSNDIEAAPRPEMAVLKQSIQAPPGYKIVAADSAQGEARILAYLAGQQDLIEAFAAGRDVYSEFASDVYGRPVDRKRVKADHIPGQVGKVGILQLGFGSGWYTAAMGFAKGMLGAPPIIFTMADMNTLQVDPSRFLGNPKNIQRVDAMPSRLVLNDRLIHCAVTNALVDRYRKRYAAIPRWWEALEGVINAMIRGEEVVFGAGLFRTAKERIYGPTGLWLDYRGLQRDDAGSATYFDGRKRTNIYGSFLCENIVQHTHRLVVSEQLMEIATLGRVVLWPYDEVVCVVPEDAAELFRQFMVSTLARSPVWAPGMPLSADGYIGSTYAECK